VQALRDAEHPKRRCAVQIRHCRGLNNNAIIIIVKRNASPRAVETG
jgi:hypothetical protein